MMMARTVPFFLLSLSLFVLLFPSSMYGGEQAAPVVYAGGDGPGAGHHVVFLTGDDEYRSEESMPMLARIAAYRQGFRSTLLMPIDPEKGTIDPTTPDNIPGMELLRDADCLVMFLRFRALPAEQMQHLLDYVASGKPIISIRTNTHPFFYKPEHPDFEALKQWSWRAEGGGFGGRILGQTWINHHGSHMGTSTRAIVLPEHRDHPVLSGIDDTFWVPSDVYGVLPLRGDCTPLVMGEVIVGKKAGGPPQEGKNRQPIVWTRDDRAPQGAKQRILVTTMGHVDDFKNENLRRLIINGCYWGMGLEDQMPEKADVEFVVPYSPTDIGFGEHRKGLTPEDLPRIPEKAESDN
jgi:hypothetical protein